MKSCMLCHKACMNVDLHCWILAGNEVGNALLETLSEESIMARFNYVGKGLWQGAWASITCGQHISGFCLLLSLALHTGVSGEQCLWMGVQRWKLNRVTFSAPAEFTLPCSRLPFPQGFVCSVECTTLKWRVCSINCSVCPESCYLYRAVCSETVLKVFHVLSSKPSPNWEQKASPVLWGCSWAPLSSPHASCPLEPKGWALSSSAASNLITCDTLNYLHFCLVNRL